MLGSCCLFCQTILCRAISPWTHSKRPLQRGGFPTLNIQRLMMVMMITIVTAVPLFMASIHSLSGLHCSATFIKSQSVRSISDCEYKGKLTTPQRSCCLFVFFLFQLSLVCQSQFYADRSKNGNTCSTSYSSTLFATYLLGGTDKLELWKDKKIKALLFSMSTCHDWAIPYVVCVGMHRRCTVLSFSYCQQIKGQNLQCNNW